MSPAAAEFASACSAAGPVLAGAVVVACVVLRPLGGPAGAPLACPPCGAPAGGAGTGGWRFPAPDASVALPAASAASAASAAASFVTRLRISVPPWSDTGDARPRYEEEVNLR